MARQEVETRTLYWRAVQELSLSSQIMDIQYMAWFRNYGN